MNKTVSSLTLILVATLLFTPYQSYAAPAAPGTTIITQPNGKKFEAKLKGDEHISWMETLDGYSILKVGNEWFYAGLDEDNQFIPTTYSVGSLAPQQLAGFQAGVTPTFTGIREKHFIIRNESSGTTTPHSQKVLVILINFTDATLTYGATDFEPLFFGASNSVKDFFTDNSYGDFIITKATESHGVADGIIEVTLGTAHPDNNSTGNKAAVAAALTAANASIDYSSFDTDANGTIEVDELSVVCIFAGDEAAQGSSTPPKTWGHKSSINPITIDGVDLSPYTAFGEIHSNRGDHIATIGIMCHELGHLMLGLPDLYDINGGSEGIGDWGLMGGGSWNNVGTYSGDSPAYLSAWSRVRTAFTTPTIITSAATGVSIESTHAISDVKEFWIDKYKSPFGSFSERFLIENRQLSGYDAGLPASGLLIFHIDESKTTNQDETHKLVDLEEANNDGDLDNETNRGDGGDPFPGTSSNTSFNDASTPNSKQYDTTVTNIGITNISASASTMTADLTPHANSGSGETIYDANPSFSTSGSFGYNGGTNWTAMELTNNTTMDQIEGFEIYCYVPTTIDFHFYTSMTSNAPTTKIGTEETGFAAVAGWNRFTLATPLSFPQGATRAMILKLVTAGNSYPAFVIDTDPSHKSWLHFSGPTGTYKKVIDEWAQDYDWRQSILLGTTVIAPLSTAWVDFAWAGIESGSEAEAFNTVDEALSGVEDAGTVNFKGDTATSNSVWTGTIDQDVSLEAINGTVTLGE